MKALRLLVLCFVAIALSTSAMAYTERLTSPARVDADLVDVNGKKYIRFTFTHTSAADTWHDTLVSFCPDPLREGCDNNIPFSITKMECTTTMIWDIPLEVIAGGQSAVNWACDEDWFNTKWLFLPDCRNLTVGRNLIYYKSLPDPMIPKSGGMHLLYVGPGAPFVPASDDPRWFRCGGYCAPSAPPIVIAPVVPAPVPPVVKPAEPCKKPASPKSICDEPCIQQISEDTSATRESVGVIDKTEPADEQKLQQKARKTLAISKRVETNTSTIIDQNNQTNDKLGTPKGEGQTLFSELDDVKGGVTIIQNQVDTKFNEIKAQVSTSFWDKWWLLILAIAAAIIILATWGLTCYSGVRIKD
jgi:hypothetical protein